MALLDDIGTHLTNNSVVEGATGWTLFKTYQPSSPDKAVTLMETPGTPPDATPGTSHTFPSFQVRVRGAEFGYSDARDKMQDVFDALHNATISGYVYVFASDSGPILVGYDEQDNRPEIVMNFNTMKSP